MYFTLVKIVFQVKVRYLLLSIYILYLKSTYEFLIIDKGMNSLSTLLLKRQRVLLKSKDCSNNLDQRKLRSEHDGAFFVDFKKGRPLKNKILVDGLVF